MVKNETRSEQHKSTPLSLIPEELAATAKKRMEEFAHTQSELFEQCKDTNRHWLDRIQAEATVASELATKLTAARSIPEAMTASQEWGSRRFEMMAEDTRHLLDDTQRFMQVGMRLMANGWQSKGPRIST